MNSTNGNSHSTTLAATPAPDARLKRPTSRAKSNAGGWIMALLLIVAVGGGAAWYFLTMQGQSGTQPQTGSTTRTAVIQRGDILLTASGSGTLVTNQAVNMSFSTSGRVAELNVKLGDMVKAGDVLARLEQAQDLEADLASAQVSLLQAQQTLAKLQKSAGSTLAKAYQDLVTAQASYDKAFTASQKVNASRCSSEVLEKYRSVLKQTSEKMYALYEIDPSSTAVTIARYDYDTALANYLYCIAYTDTEKVSAYSSLEVAAAALQKAQDQYNTLSEASGIDPDTLSMNETKVETAQTLVDEAQEALDGITLKAAMDGKITYLAASAGAIVDTATFLTISDVSHPVVTVSLDETDMDKLVEGNSAQVTFTALPGQTFSGKVSLANPEMIRFGPFRAASGQVELSVPTVDEEAARIITSMPLGLSASVTISGKEAHNVLLAPVAALKQLNTGEYVVKVVNSAGQLVQQTVTVGLQNDSYAEITGGLEEGATVSFTVTNSSNSRSVPTVNDQSGGLFMIGGGGMPMP